MSRHVVDASVLAEILLDTPRGRVTADRFGDPADEMHAPHLVVTECLSVIRGWARSGQIDDVTAADAVAALGAFPVELWDERPFLPAAWAHRHNLSADDAQYVALAVALDAPVHTHDRRLARAAAQVCEVRAG